MRNGMCGSIIEIFGNLIGLRNLLHKKPCKILDQEKRKNKSYFMESYILLSELNDFIFCPRSIYFHHIFGRYDTSLYHQTPQIAWNIAHTTIDKATYSTKKRILQGTAVYSEEYGIAGKIDTFDIESGILTERKKKVERVYYGYKLQLYGQHICLHEMGYIVRETRIHSLDDNKNYLVPYPSVKELQHFREILDQFRTFRLAGGFIPNREKCQKCIYNTLCDKSLV